MMTSRASFQRASAAPSPRGLGASQGGYDPLRPSEHRLFRAYIIPLWDESPNLATASCHRTCTRNKRKRRCKCWLFRAYIIPLWDEGEEITHNATPSAIGTSPKYDDIQFGVMGSSPRRIWGHLQCASRRQEGVGLATP